MLQINNEILNNKSLKIAIMQIYKFHDLKAFPGTIYSSKSGFEHDLSLIISLCYVQ